MIGLPKKQFILPTLLSVLGLIFAFPCNSAAQSAHTFNPVNNESVDKLNLVEIYFDEAEVNDIYKPDDFIGKKWAVRNEKGDSIAGAYIFGCESPIAVLKVQPSIYTKGKYTINIPEGYLWLYDINDNRTLAPSETLTYNVTGKQDAPSITPVFSPAPAEPVSYLSSLTFKVSGYTAYNTDINTRQKITVTDESGTVVANGQPEYNYADSCGVVNLDKVLNTAGKYTVHIPGNIFRIATDWNAYYAGDYEMLPACEVTYDIEGGNVTKYEVSGAGSSSCTAIKLTFPEHNTVSINPERSYLLYTICNSEGFYRNMSETWDDLISTDGNTVTLQLYSPLTFPDNYNFTVPEGDFVFDDGTYNTTLAVTFNVTEPKETHISSDPENGSIINELYSVDVTFKDATFISEVYSNKEYELTDSLGNAMTDKNGNTLAFCVDDINTNTATLRLTDGYDFTTFTTPGTYHIILPASSFFVNKEKTEVNSKIVVTFKLEKGEDTHTYVTWGYYDNDDVESLGALGVENVDTYNVAIFVPGNGVLHNAKLVGAKIPVRDSYAVASIKAWTAKSLADNMEYLCTANINYPHNGYNSVRFDSPLSVPAEGCYLGYTVRVKNDQLMGTAYPVVYDESVKTDRAFYMSIPGYAWYDYGPKEGVSALQGLFMDLDLSDASATFGSIENGVTQTGTTSDWDFPITTNSESAVTELEYEMEVAGKSYTRTAMVNIPAGYKQQGSMTVSITSPDETGTYDVRLTVLKINGKENSIKTTAVSTFANVMRTVTRRTLVEEFTGTGCGWCPRGLIGLQNLNKAYGDSVICIAFHRYNANDPMWCNYASTDELNMTGAPECAIDRKVFADPYTGNESTQNGIIEEVGNYISQPASADITVKAAWTTTDCKEVKIDATLESFTDDRYQLVYVITADDLYADSKLWQQSNYFASYSANQYPDDLALFCKDGEYGTDRFRWRYDDVVIGSSYDENGNNTATDSWTMSAGTKKNGTFTVTLSDGDIITEAIKGSIDKVYAVVFALDSKHQVAQAAKSKVVEVMPSGINTIQTGKCAQKDSYIYNLNGQRITTPRKGQVVIHGGKKVVY